MQTCKHTEYNLINNKERERERERERNNICRDQSLSWTINSNWTFTDTNPGIKKNHNHCKTKKGTLKMSEICSEEK